MKSNRRRRGKQTDGRRCKTRDALSKGGADEPHDEEDGAGVHVDRAEEVKGHARGSGSEEDHEHACRVRLDVRHGGGKRASRREEGAARRAEFRGEVRRVISRSKVLVNASAA